MSQLEFDFSEHRYFAHAAKMLDERVGGDDERHARFLPGLGVGRLLGRLAARRRVGQAKTRQRESGGDDPPVQAAAAVAAAGGDQRGDVPQLRRGKDARRAGRRVAAKRSSGHNACTGRLRATVAVSRHQRRPTQLRG